MDIRDFIDVKQIEDMMQSWSDATGLATIGVDSKGEYFTKAIVHRERRLQGRGNGKESCLLTHPHSFAHSPSFQRQMKLRKRRECKFAASYLVSADVLDRIPDKPPKMIPER